MPRKQRFEGGTKNRIIAVGGRLFFERGFDGTGIRQIMKAVGADVGGFYYYFKSKDELFDAVLENFFVPIKEGFARIADSVGDDPAATLLEFFRYVRQITVDFREKYEENMHRTVRWAIREQTLTVMEPYIEQILQALKEKDAKPMMEDLHLCAVFLSHGVGSVILHEDIEFVDNAEDELRRTARMVLGLK